ITLSDIQNLRENDWFYHISKAKNLLLNLLKSTTTSIFTASYNLINHTDKHPGVEFSDITHNFC
ncbi:TPA: hypothetical protein ACT9MT_002875, partial [Legionella pneumophila]